MKSANNADEPNIICEIHQKLTPYCAMTFTQRVHEQKYTVQDIPTLPIPAHPLSTKPCPTLPISAHPTLPNPAHPCPPNPAHP